MQLASYICIYNAATYNNYMIFLIRNNYALKTKLDTLILRQFNFILEQFGVGRLSGIQEVISPPLCFFG